jgi:hypothetical protein
MMMTTTDPGPRRDGTPALINCSFGDPADNPDTAQGPSTPTPGNAALLMTYENLADVLQDMADRVRAGDSWEGHIEYWVPMEDDAAADDPPDPNLVAVTAVYRVGNLQGQGGMRMFGAA